MRAFLEQRAENNAYLEEIAQRSASIDDLEREKRRWNDPAYVQAQARERLSYVMPGETSYIVLDEDGNALESESELRDPSEVDADRVPEAWCGKAWDSGRAAAADRDRRLPAAVIDPTDEAAIHAQLGREPRAIHAVGHRCPCGNPDVVTTEPRLPNGTPFPTTFYLTCPRAASLI
eukprot:gene4704-5586_t